MSIGKLLVAIVIIAACVAITFVALGAMGITVPPFVVTILWIIGVAVIAVVAIILLLKLWQATPPSP